MHPILSLAAVSVLAITTLAAPTSEKQGSFTVQQRAVGTVLKNGAQSYVKVHKKFGASVPAHILAAADGTQSGYDTANPESYNAAYLCDVQIGTPPQTLSMDFDSGSSDLWVFSSETTSGADNHEIYDPNQSSTSSEVSGVTWQIGYGDGSSASGNVYTDTVVIGGVIATGQAVELATTVSDSFAADVNNDGLVGLAFDSINTCGPDVCNTFMGNVAGSLSSPLFAAYLLKDAAGSYDFGALNPDHYTGDITYVDVDKSQGYWGITVDGYGTNDGGQQGSSFSAIVDTGTSLLALPGSIVDAYWAQVSGAYYDSNSGGYIFPCSTTDSYGNVVPAQVDLPSLELYIGGVAWCIPGSSMNWSPSANGYCYGGLQSSDNVGLAILGDVFINNFYVVFNYVSEWDNSQIGLAYQPSSY